MLSNLSNPYISSILACLAPTIAFAGVNAHNFSSKQIFFASFASLLCGSIFGGLVSFLPPIYVSGIACLGFCLFSERLLFSIFPAFKNRILFCGIFIALAALSTYWWNLLPLNILFTIYLIFSLKDLYTNAQRPKEDVFDANNLSINDDEEIPYECSVNLKEKPDIFLLFWESMHDRESIKELYDIDDEELYTYLDEKDFTVYPNSFSNSCTTRPSFNTIMNMNHLTHTPKNTPSAIQILHSNGYDIHFFDSSLHSFQAHVKYARSFNLTIPKYIAIAYDYMIPFFMQSKYLLRITKNLDPFDDTVANNMVLKAVTDKIQKTDSNPQCYIIRMGAQHTPNQYLWVKKEKWTPKYREIFYPKASISLRETINTILRYRPKALIAVTGDHGAHCLRAVWSGSNNDPNENIIHHGETPATVTRSFASILLATRWPEGKKGQERILSPCNIFRHIFCYLGGEGAMLQPVENLVFFPTPPFNQFILAREGQILERWEALSRGEALVHEAQQLMQTDSPESRAHLTTLFIINGNLDNALKSARRAVDKYPLNPDLHIQLASLFIRIGQTSEASTLCEKALVRMPHENDLLTTSAYILALQGKTEQALQLLNDNKEYIEELNQIRSSIFILAGDTSNALIAAKQHFVSLGSTHTKKQKTNTNKFRTLSTIVNLLDNAGQFDDAIDVTHEIVEKDKNSTEYYNLPTILNIHRFNWEESEKALRTVFHKIVAPFPYIYFLLLMGVLEQQGKIKEALQVYKDENGNLNAIPNFSIQIGLFAIRNKLSGEEFFAHKKLAYTYLRQERTWLQQRNLFDADWYSEKYAGILHGEEPILHYLHFRQMLFLDPNPLFNSAFYYLTQYDVFLLAMEPLRHFIQCSSFENRNPSLFFDVCAYMTQHPETANKNVNTLVHHLCPEYYASPLQTETSNNNSYREAIA